MTQEGLRHRRRTSNGPMNATTTSTATAQQRPPNNRHHHDSDGEGDAAETSRPLLQHDDDGQNHNNNNSASGGSTRGRGQSAPPSHHNQYGNNHRTSSSDWKRSVSFAVSEAACSFMDLLPNNVQTKLQPTLSPADDATMREIRSAFVASLGERFDASQPSHVALLEDLWYAGHRAKRLYYDEEQQRRTVAGGSYTPPPALSPPSRNGYGSTEVSPARPSASSAGDAGSAHAPPGLLDQDLPPFLTHVDPVVEPTTTTTTAADAAAPPLLNAWRSEAWKQFGFQGIDPATDFRGGGLLSLSQLVYLGTTYPLAYAMMFVKEEYPFAVAGINITAFLNTLLDLFPATDGAHRIASLQAHWQRSYSAAQAKVHVCRWLCAAWRHARSPDNIAPVTSSSAIIVSDDVDGTSRGNPRDAAALAAVQLLLGDLYTSCCCLVHEEWTLSKRNLMEFQQVMAKGTKKFVDLVKCCETLHEAQLRLPNQPRSGA